VNLRASRRGGGGRDRRKEVVREQRKEKKGERGSTQILPSSKSDVRDVGGGCVFLYGRGGRKGGDQIHIFGNIVHNCEEGVNFGIR